MSMGQDRNKDADTENGLEDTGKGKDKLGRSERVAWTNDAFLLVNEN